MELIIKSRTRLTLEGTPFIYRFYRPRFSNIINIEIVNPDPYGGNSRSQICEGGNYSGSTTYYLGSDINEFKKICRRWYKQNKNTTEWLEFISQNKKEENLKLYLIMDNGETNWLQFETIAISREKAFVNFYNEVGIACAVKSQLKDRQWRNGNGTINLIVGYDWDCYEITNIDELNQLAEKTNNFGLGQDWDREETIELLNQISN